MSPKEWRKHWFTVLPQDGAFCNDVIKTHRRCYVTQTTAVPLTEDGVTLKPLSKIPGPRGLPGIGTLWDYMKPNGLKFNKMFEVSRRVVSEKVHEAC